MSGHRFFSASVAGATISKQRFWQMAMLTAAGTLVATPQADAATMFYWQDPIPATTGPHRWRSRASRKPASLRKGRSAVKETNAKPQGPLIIAVSIEQQKVRVYDANGLFAESPVSTA